MFSLIITIISIALVTALALATIYYGGSAFRQGGDAAAAAKLINEGQQLSGAAAIVEANAGTVDTQANLVIAKALQSNIGSYNDAVSGRAFTTPATVKTDVCVKVNEKAQGKLSTDPLFVAPADAASITNYGCFAGAGADQGTMVFKY